MEPHKIGTRVPVDTLIGDEMVIFRSSRRPWKHNGIEKGQTLILHGVGADATGLVLETPVQIPFRDISQCDIRDGYFKGACTRETLMACLREMYQEYGYEEDT